MSAGQRIALLAAIVVALVTGYSWINHHPASQVSQLITHQAPGPAAKEICAKLDSGTPVLLVDLDLINADMSPSEAGTRLRQAVQDQCPNHGQDLDEAVKRANEFQREHPRQ